MNKSGQSEKRFGGPLFVVGMPRSGTKLLRGLLNGHPRLGFAMAESQFLPFLVANASKFGDLAERDAFGRFYEYMTGLPYFVYMQEQGPGIIDCDEWYRRCTSFTPADLFESLLRHDTHAPVGGETIWGDKTPSYIIHTPLLKQLFPDARIIHIVRDVRDYAISCRKAWGKNMLRAAQRWTDRIGKFERDSADFSNDIMMLRYEDLLSDPETELRRICGFVNIEFDPGMLTLSRPSENLGDAKGQTRIVADNFDKYRKQMSEKTLRKIESLAAPMLERYSYTVGYKGPAKRLGKLALLAYRLQDGLNLLRFEMRERPLLEAIRFQWSLFWTSGNRPWASRRSRGE